MFKPMDKRGQGLTLNTIIITILVVLVLIVVVTFFFGGFKGLTERITGTFYTTTAGTDQVLAVQTCEQFCEQAKLLPKSLISKSAYCTQPFVIDGSTKILDSGEHKNVYVCNPSNINVDGVRSKINTKSKLQSLGVTCSIKCTG